MYSMDCLEPSILSLAAAATTSDGYKIKSDVCMNRTLLCVMESNATLFNHKFSKPIPMNERKAQMSISSSDGILVKYKYIKPINENYNLCLFAI
jgi:hypothetical protein